MKLPILFVAATMAIPMAAQAYTFDRNVPTAVKDQILNDMQFLGALTGNGVTPLHTKIFGSVDGATYGKFFESRVTNVGLNSCGGGSAVACVIPFLGSSKIWLTQNYIKFSHPQIAKLLVLFHESRHTEVRNSNWSHASCPTPFVDSSGNEMRSIWTGAVLAGQPACDITPLGSYGSSTIMLKNVQKFCTNCTEKVKMDAGLYADDQFLRITSDDAKKEMQQDLYSSN